MENLLNAIANSTIEEKILLLPQALEHGELGIDFLIDILKDPCLEIRAKAYELLQSVETDKAKKAIAPGLLLNPGDKIYSVYQSTMRFTDDGYYLSDSVGYTENLTLLIYEEESFGILEEAELHQSKRLYCCLNRQEAEKKAEALHRELIRDEDACGLDLEWERNTDISIEQWLADNLTNNQLDFDNWDNRQNALESLHLPENIEILSKFYQDGVGRFAFVRSEIVEQKTYIRINQQLEDSAIDLVVIPKKYDTHAVDFLLHILNSEYSNPKQVNQARQFLQHLDSDYIPF